MCMNILICSSKSQVILNFFKCFRFVFRKMSAEVAVNNKIMPRNWANSMKCSVMCSTLHCESDIYNLTHSARWQQVDWTNPSAFSQTTHFPWYKIRKSRWIWNCCSFKAASFTEKLAWPCFLGSKDTESWRGWARKRRGGGRSVWGGTVEEVG